MEDNPWSIIPIDDCARVDNNGLVTFDECATGKTYTVIYNNGMCESKTTIIVKKEDVCNKFIVDGGEWDNVPSTGDTTCDSAFLYLDGTPQFTPETASTWITINKYYWGINDPSTMCTNYRDFPCVANDLMRDAGIVDNDISCSDVPTPTMADMPEIVREAITGDNEYTHALGTIRYTVAPNPTNKPRSCTIRWIVNSQECPSRDFTITQLGALVCKCTDLVVSGDKTIESDANTNIEIGTYTAGCVTNIAASELADWVTSISADNGSIKASVRENTSTMNIRATEITVTGKAGSDICIKSFTLTQKAKSEPTVCSKFIVDGGKWNNVPASGDSTCDSAFLWVDGVPQFTPTSASSWVDIQFVHWDEDPHTYQYFCTVYTDFPCVANDLMRDAGIVDNDINCSDVPTPTMDDMPEIVREAITGDNEYTHALGTVRYTIAPNDTDEARSCTIRWIVDSQECPSRDFTITQLGGETPTVCTCNDLKLTRETISYEAKSNIQIGSFAVTCMTNINATASSKDWVTNLSVDGTKIMANVAQNTTGAEREAIITVTGKTETEDCSNTFKVKQQGATPTTCTCQEADVQVSEEIITLESTQGDNSFTDITYNCKPEISINDECDWLDVNLNETEGRLEFTSTKDNIGNERSGYTYIKGGSETCLTITVKQKQTSQCKVPTGNIHIFLDASNFHYHNPDMYRYYITNDVIGINCERVLRNYSQGIGAPSENQPVSISHYEYNDCTFKFTFGGESYYEITSPSTECEVEAKDLSPGATYYLYVYNTLTSSFSQQGTFKMPTTEEAQEDSLNKEIYIKI